MKNLNAQVRTLTTGVHQNNCSLIIFIFHKLLFFSKITKQKFGTGIPRTCSRLQTNPNEYETNESGKMKMGQINQQVGVGGPKQITIKSCRSKTVDSAVSYAGTARAAPGSVTRLVLPRGSCDATWRTLLQATLITGIRPQYSVEKNLNTRTKIAFHKSYLK